MHTFRRVLSCILVMSLLVTTGLALDGVYHNPTGWDNLYDDKEVSSDPCERYPRDPGAGEDVYIKSKTWPNEPGQAVWIAWTKNGVPQSVINADWKYNSGNETHWEACLGSFAKGDEVEYYVHADQYGSNQNSTGPFSFIVTDWDSVQAVSSVSVLPGRVELTCTSASGTLAPKISISFPGTGYFRLQLEPLGTGSFESGLTNFTVDQSNPSYLWINGPGIKLKIHRGSYAMEVYDSEGTLLTKESTGSGNRGLSFKTNGTDFVNIVEENLFTPAEEAFTGFGMRYDAVNQRGNNVDIYTVNWYLEQGNKTYLAIPFFISNQGYGMFLNTTYYTQYRLATDASDRATIRATAGGHVNTGMDMYFFAGEPKEISQQYTDVIEKPALPPVWAFGPWVSANEWNKQSEIEEQLYQMQLHDIASTAMVIEAWADEETFYIWGDAEYTPQGGDWMPTLDDFTFGGRWPDPKGMVDELHENGIHVLLWQLPLIKSADNPIPQLAADEAYAIDQGYVLGDGTGQPYRNKGGWYGNAVSPDFTSTAATEWLLGKREYLMSEIGIDGFKCDGGEFIWGRSITASDGTKGDELRNLYPDLYIQAYTDFAKSYNPDTATFFRAGGVGAGQHPIAWAGDQNSSFSAYRDAIRATLTASMSGVPFVTWDLAGFSGEIPTTELYKRSVAQAAFSPIMQVHSEWGGDPSPSVARTPWNMYARTGDYECIEIYRTFTNYRMSLIPYLYNEAKYTNATGVPMMRSMAYEYPNDTVAAAMEFQYMLGDNLIVAPIENEGQYEKLLYLPEGEWIDLFWGASRPGNSMYTYYADLDSLPVFVKAGSILPMNLNSDYDFGGSVGNSVTEYQNLVFRIYPSGTTVYDYYDYVNDDQAQLCVEEDYANKQIAVSLPALAEASTLQVYTDKPTQVKLDNTALTQYANLEGLKNASQGWYYDVSTHLAYVKAGASAVARDITLDGVGAVPYEAEFATRQDVGVNTNHAGYEGTGFVDGFNSTGSYIEFDIYAPAGGVYNLDIRYSAGTTSAVRTLYVDGTLHSAFSLTKTANWDSWDTKRIPVFLTQGGNKIRIAYDPNNYAGINIDNIRIHP